MWFSLLTLKSGEFCLVIEVINLSCIYMFFGKKNQSLWQRISLELHYNQEVSLVEQKGWNTAKRVKRRLEFDCKPLLWATRVS